MSEKGNLYKTISVRFSLINEQHVRCLQKIENQGRAAGMPKSQIIIKALEDHFGEMDDDGMGRALAEAKEDIGQYAQGIKETIKREIRQELMAELLGMVSGIDLRGTAAGTAAASPPADGTEDGAFDLEKNEGIVESAMKWG